MPLQPPGPPRFTAEHAWREACDSGTSASGSPAWDAVATPRSLLEPSSDLHEVGGEEGA